MRLLEKLRMVRVTMAKFNEKRVAVKNESHNAPLGTLTNSKTTADLTFAGQQNLTAPVSINDLVRAFLEGRKNTTLDTYSQCLEDFAKFLGVTDVEDAAKTLLSRSHGEANLLGMKYRADLVGRDIAAATINTRLAALRSLVKLAGVFGIVPWQLEVSNVKSTAYRNTRGPGSDGIRLLMGEAGKRADTKGTRDVAILHLLYDLALRRAEVVRLDVDDVDLDAGLLAVVGKGKTEPEKHTLPKPTAVALRAWLEIRGTEPGALFVNFDRAGKGKRLTGRSVHRIVSKLGDNVGIRAKPHGLRHSAVTAALDKTNGDVRAVQKYSRHADLRTLNRYDDTRADLAGEVAQLVAEVAPDNLSSLPQ